MKTKNNRSAKRLPQRTAIASAVMLAFVTPAALAQYKPNVEVYVKPGSERNYLGVDGLVPLVENGTSLFFADAKAHMITESSANEVNLGLGYRALTADQQWAWGVYGAFDYKNTKYDNHFNQITVGAELRSREWDFRSNYYQILTDKKFVGLGATNHFAGNGVWRNGVYEEGLSGFDVEVGRLLDISDRYDVRAYLAGYSFKSKEFGTHDDGVRARLEVRPQKNFILGVSLQHDSLFGSVGFVEMRYAFGQSSESGPRTLGERMTDPWKRDQDIVTSGALESETAGNSVQTTDNAVHIDSSVAASGDGSYEHPYKSVSNCDAGKCTDELPSGAGRYNLIRLWQGNSRVSPYASMTLLDGQTLWGQGVDFYSGRTQSGLYPVIRTSSAPAVFQAQAELPGGIGSEPAPLLNGGKAGVTLASNGSIGNAVVGVKIEGSGTGIYGANTWGNVTIDRNNIDVRGTGISLVNGSGPIDRVGVSKLNSYAVGGAQNLRITGNTISAFDDGIAISNDAKPGETINQTVTISGNRIDSKYMSGVSIGNSTAEGTHISQKVVISNNEIFAPGLPQGDKKLSFGKPDDTAYGGGIDLRNASADGGVVDQTVMISGNDIQAKYGVSLANSAGTDGRVTQGGTISGNTILGFKEVVGLTNGAASGGQADQTVTISGNQLSSKYGAGIHATNRATSGGDATQALVITGNTLTFEDGRPMIGLNTKGSPGEEGIVLSNNDASMDSSGSAHGAIQNVTISGSNTITGFNSGLDVTSYGLASRSSQTVQVSGLTVDEGEFGIGYCNFGTSSQTVSGGSGNTLNGLPTAPEKCRKD